jgi:hypothetical protein
MQVFINEIEPIQSMTGKEIVAVSPILFLSKMYENVHAHLYSKYLLNFNI